MPKKLKYGGTGLYPLSRHFGVIFICLLMPLLLLTGCQFMLPELSWLPDLPKLTELDLPRMPWEKPPEITEVIISQSAPILLALPLYLADELGYCAEENLRLTLLAKASPEEALASLIAGESALALTGPEYAFYHSQQPEASPIVLLAQLSVQSGHYLLGRPDNASFSWSGLRGKSVLGRPPGALPEIFFEQLLRQNSLRASVDVHVVQNLPEHLLRGAWLAGAGHYLLAPEPLAAALETENAARIVAALEAPATAVTAAVLSTPEFMQNRLTTAQGLLRALNLSLAWLQERTPEEIVQASKKLFPAYEEKILLRAISRYKTSGLWPKQAEIDAAGLENILQIMLDNKELNASLPVEQFIYQAPPEDESGGFSSQ